jgi:hypothetical protein
MISLVNCQLGSKLTKIIVEWMKTMRDFVFLFGAWSNFYIAFCIWSDINIYHIHM